MSCAATIVGGAVLAGHCNLLDWQLATGTVERTEILKMAATFIRLRAADGWEFVLPRRAWSAFVAGNARLLKRLAPNSRRVLNADAARVAGIYLRFAMRKLKEGVPTRLMVHLSACPDFCDSPAVHELAAFLVKSGGCKALPVVRSKATEHP